MDKPLHESRVDVVLDATNAHTKVSFVRDPMLGQSVLDTAKHPIIRFTSIKLQPGPTGRISEGTSL